MQKKEVKKMRVLYAYRAEHEWELSLFINDVVEVIDEFVDESDHTYDGWWSGKMNGKIGLFPVSYCEELKIKRLIVAESKASTTIKLLQLRCGLKKVRSAEPVTTVDAASATTASAPAPPTVQLTATQPVAATNTAPVAAPTPAPVVPVAAPATAAVPPASALPAPSSVPASPLSLSATAVAAPVSLPPPTSLPLPSIPPPALPVAASVTPTSLPPLLPPSSLPAPNLPVPSLPTAAPATLSPVSVMPEAKKPDVALANLNQEFAELKKQIQRSAAQAEKEREEQRQALRDRFKSDMSSWDGSLSGAINSANAVIKGLVSAAEADTLRRQVNTLKEAAQLRADDVVIFLLEQIYVSLQKQRAVAVPTVDASQSSSAGQLQQLMDENKKQFERITALTAENATLKSRVEDTAALQKKAQNLEVQLEQLVSDAVANEQSLKADLDAARAKHLAAMDTLAASEKINGELNAALTKAKERIALAAATSVSEGGPSAASITLKYEEKLANEQKARQFVEAELQALKSGTNWKEKYDTDMKTKDALIKQLRLQLKEANEKVTQAQTSFQAREASYNLKIAKQQHTITGLMKAAEMAAGMATAAGLGKAPPRPTALAAPSTPTSTAVPQSGVPLNDNKPKALVPGAPPPEGPIIHTMSLEVDKRDKDSGKSPGKSRRLSGLFSKSEVSKEKEEERLKEEEQQKKEKEKEKEKREKEEKKEKEKREKAEKKTKEEHEKRLKEEKEHADRERARKEKEQEKKAADFVLHLPDDVASLKKELLALQRLVQEEREARLKSDTQAKEEAAALAADKTKLITMNRALMVEMNTMLLAQKKKPGGIGFAAGTK